jgi:thiamine pyrophosphokinase
VVRAAQLGQLGSDHVVIAADSGLEGAGLLGLPVDLVVGDMDSVDMAALDAAVAAGARVDRHPEAKDATDLDLALDAALAHRPTRLVVVTGQGDRFDHAMAVALSLASPRYAGVAVEAWIGPAHLWVVRHRYQAVLRGSPGDLVTLLPVHGPVRGVTTSGLLYGLDGGDLEPGTTRGVSNEMAGETATVRVASGVLLAIKPGHSGTHWRRAQRRAQS